MDRFALTTGGAPGKTDTEKGPVDLFPGRAGGAPDEGLFENGPVDRFAPTTGGAPDEWRKEWGVRKVGRSAFGTKRLVAGLFERSHFGIMMVD